MDEGNMPSTPPRAAEATGWQRSPDVTATVEGDLSERMWRTALADNEREIAAAAQAAAARRKEQGASTNVGAFSQKEESVGGGFNEGSGSNGSGGREGSPTGRTYLRGRRRYFSPTPGSPGPGSSRSSSHHAVGDISPSLAEARAAARAHAGVPTGEEKREALLGELRRNCEVYKSLGNSAYGRADYAQAIASYERAVESAGLFAELFEGAGTTAGKFVDKDGVAWSVKSFLSIIHSNLSAARQMLGDSGMLCVLAECVRAVQLDAANVRALVRLGQVRIKLGLVEDARRDLSIAFADLCGSDPKEFGLVGGGQEGAGNPGRMPKEPVGSAEAVERWGDDKVKALLVDCIEGLKRCKDLEAIESAADAALASRDAGKIEKALAEVQRAFKVAAHSSSLAALRADMLMRTGASRRAFRFCDAWASNYDSAVRGKHDFECEQQRDAHGTNQAGIAVLRAKARFWMGGLDDAVSLLSTLIERTDVYQCAVRSAKRGEGHVGCCTLEKHIQEVSPRLAAEARGAPALLAHMRALAASKRAANEAYQAGNFERADSLYLDGLAPGDGGSGLLVPPAVEAVFHGNRGAALKGLERWPEAIAACSRAMALDPDYLRAVIRRAQLWSECGLCGEAADDWDRSVALLEQALAEDAAAAKAGMSVSTKSGATRGELADAKRNAKEQRTRSARSGVVNHWRLLGISAGATGAEVKTSFRKAALKLHPDKTGGTTSTLFNAIREAHDTLSDSGRRAEWEADVAREARRHGPVNMGSTFAHTWAAQRPSTSGRSSARPNAYPSTQNPYKDYEQPFRPAYGPGGASSKENRDRSSKAGAGGGPKQGYYHNHDYGGQSAYSRGDRAYHNVPRDKSHAQGPNAQPRRNPYSAGY